MAIVLDGTVVPDREEIGNKAHSLATMHGLGMPVPPAFVLTTAVGKRCAGGLPDDVWADVLAALAQLEAATGRRFGEELLVSVRSGAAQSMPGMMDTILNLGITDAVEAALAAASGDAAFARDTHRRFRESYARLVGQRRPGRPARAAARRDLHGVRVVGLAARAWPTATTAACRTTAAPPSPCRRWSTATSTTGPAPACCSPATRRAATPRRWASSCRAARARTWCPARSTRSTSPTSRERLPEVHAALLDAGRALERHARDVQDIEFTVERGRLYLLQTRVAKRSARAALKLAVDFVDEGVLTPAEALARIRPDHVATVLRPVLDPEARARRHRAGPRRARLPRHRVGPGRGRPGRGRVRAATTRTSCSCGTPRAPRTCTG